MAVKIPCGGFEIDENSFEFDGDVLKSKISGGSSGYEVTKTSIADKQTITTTVSGGDLVPADGAYAALTEGQECIVVINEQKYTGVAELDFSTPTTFNIVTDGGTVSIASATSGSFYTGSADEYEVECYIQEVDVSDDFEEAVGQVVKTNTIYVHFVYDDDTSAYVCDMNLADMYGYFNQDIPIVGVMEGYEYPMVSMDGFNNIAIFQSYKVLSGELTVHTVTYSRDGITDTFDTYDLSSLVVSDG